MELTSPLAPLLSHASSILTLDSPSTPSESHTLSCWHWSSLDRLQSRNSTQNDRSLIDQFSQIVNVLGERSAKAQALKQVITSWTKFSHSTDRIYLHTTTNIPSSTSPASTSSINGLLRTGTKHLFIRDEHGVIKEITPLCVLDFYIYENKQRCGYGKQLFEFMLQSEGSINPARLGYDRPSPKLFEFLSKYYQLNKYVPQNNNFVVFRKYWSKDLQQTPNNAKVNSEEKFDTQQRNSLSASGKRRNSPLIRSADQQYTIAAGVNSRQNNTTISSSSSASSATLSSSSSSYPQISPPPGEATFSHQYDASYDSNDAVRRQLNFNSTGCVSHDASSTAAAAYPHSQHQQHPSPYHRQSSSPYHSSSSASFDGNSHPSHNQSFTPSRSTSLARAGGHVMSSGNLHSTAAASPLNARTNRPVSGSRFDGYASSSPSVTAAPASAYASPSSDYHSSSSITTPPPRLTQYHTHNIINGFQPSSGSGVNNSAGGTYSNFSNVRNSVNSPAATVSTPSSSLLHSSELTHPTRALRSGIQTRPIHDPAPNGLRKVDARITALEASLQAKEQELLQRQQGDGKYHYYRQPNVYDAGWSKAATYQHMQVENERGVNPTNVDRSTGRSEAGSVYSNPARSTLIGGGRNEPYGHSLQPQHVQRSPFAYGVTAGRR